MARVDAHAEEAAAKPERGPGTGQRRTWAQRRAWVSLEMAPPAVCSNEPDPVCEALAAVIVDLFESSGMAGYQIALCTGLARQTVWNLLHRKGQVDLKTVVIVARAFFFSTTELVAIAEEEARETSIPMD